MGCQQATRERGRFEGYHRESSHKNLSQRLMSNGTGAESIVSRWQLSRRCLSGGKKKEINRFAILTSRAEETQGRRSVLRFKERRRAVTFCQKAMAKYAKRWQSGVGGVYRLLPGSSAGGLLSWRISWM